MSETTESAAPEHRADAGSPRLRRTRITIVTIAAAMSVLALLLVLAAWRDDMLISSDKGVTSAEVLSAGRLRSAITYVTPDGLTHNPKVGVLYPTKLTAGERINVEYSRSDPELVRVAGRDARVAIIPALSVVVVVWAATLPVLWLVRRLARRRPPVRGAE